MRNAAPAFPLFVRVARASAWLEATLTPLGRVLGALLVASAIFGADPGRTRAGVLAAALAALFLAARIANVGWRPVLRVARLLPTMATVGAPVRYTLQLTNACDRTEPAFDVQDLLEQPEPALTALARHARDADGNNGDNWFDRRSGFRRWQRLRRLLRGGRIAPQAVPALAAHESRGIDTTFIPLRRGRLRFSGVEFARTDPLGISRRRIQLHCADVLLVLPQHYPLPGFARRVAGGPLPGRGTGDGHRAGGDEFHSLREYRRGDAWRHVHWRASARRGEIVVRQFMAQGRPPVSILFDAGGDSALFEAALSVVTSLAVAAVLHARQLPEVLFTARDGGVTRLAGGTAAGPGGHALLQVLACLQDSETRAVTTPPPWPAPTGCEVWLVTTRAPAAPLRPAAHPLPAAVARDAWRILAVVRDDRATAASAAGVHPLRVSHLAADLSRLDRELLCEARR